MVAQLKYLLFNNGGEEETGYIDSDSEYFNLINIARIKNISTKDEYDTDLYSDDMDYNLVEIIEAELNNYKKSFALYDFTDMIEKFVGSELCPKFDVVFIDELPPPPPVPLSTAVIIPLALTVISAFV